MSRLLILMDNGLECDTSGGIHSCGHSSGIALPLFVILLLQVLMVMLFARFVAFPLFGGNYDAALLISGLCGFGLGATPNAMANMNAVCGKYRYSALPFLVVPMVGAMFVDLINVAVTSIFLNLI